MDAAPDLDAEVPDAETIASALEYPIRRGRAVRNAWISSVTASAYPHHGVPARELDDLFDDSSMPADEAAEMWTQMADVYPNIAKLIPVATVTHDEGGSVVGGGCDDQFEFEFALDLILEGLERLRASQA